MSRTDRDGAPASAPGVDPRVARHGGLSYLEIPASDVRRSAEFYQSVLGWNVEWRDAGDARFEDGTGHLIGRWVSGRPASREPGMLPYLYVVGIDQAIARALERGGEIVRPAYAEGNLWVAT